eukprot:COSAG03_NODE_1623_length_3757_cov_9.235375_3_plen_58_part_00
MYDALSDQQSARVTTVSDRGVSLIPGRWYVGMGGHGDEELALAAAAIDASFAAITSK